MTVTDVEPGNLAMFLQTQNEAFVKDLKDGKGKGWTVVSGNEAGGEFEEEGAMYGIQVRLEVEMEHCR
jgi:hypothetical protein